MQPWSSLFTTIGLVPSSSHHLFLLFLPFVLWALTHSWAKQQGYLHFLRATLAVAFWEELLFRGFVYGLALNISHNVVTSIAASALLFGLFHLRNLWWADRKRVLVMCLSAGLLTGPFLGLTRWWAGDIYVAIVAHFLLNYAALLMQRNIPRDDFLESVRHRQNKFERFFSGLGR